MPIITPANVVGGSFHDVFVKTASGSWGTSGFSSVESIVGDGYIEWTVLGLGTYTLGVSTSDPDQNYNTIQYAYVVDCIGGGSHVMESGSLISSFGAPAYGTVFRIERVGTTITYYRDGVSQRVSTGATSSPLYADVALETQNVTVIGPITMDGSDITPTNLVGGSLVTDFFIKTAATFSWNAGFSSVETIVGDGYIEFLLTEFFDKSVGLSTSDPNQFESSIDFSWRVIGGTTTVQVYEEGPGFLGSPISAVAYVTVLKIERVGTTITYYLNGVSQHATTGVTTAPLYVDTAVFDRLATLRPVTLSSAAAPGVVDLAGDLAGDTTLAGGLTYLSLGIRGALFGNTAMSGQLGGKLALAGLISGGTDLGTPFLRINGEPNIFLAGALLGSTAMSGALLTVGLGMSGELVGGTEMHGSLSVTGPDEPSIIIFVDILDADIVAAQNTQTRRYTSRLLVDGDEIPIRQANLEARKGELGTELRVTLAIADRDQVDFTSSITFEIGIWTTEWVWIPLLEDGRLSSMDAPIRNADGRPADEVSISIVDVIANRWNRAPRAPIHLYDPTEINAPDQSQIASQKIELQAGGVIVPVNTPISGMTLVNVLEAAYVTGTGFSEVITNIPDFPVTQADFTLDGGYDAGVRPLLSLFSPLMFERNNTLFIIDPDGPLPAGFTARAFPQSLTRELTDSTPQREPVNAILLRLKGDATGGEFSTERTDTELSYGGQFASNNYTETLIEKRVREWHSGSPSGPIVREEEISETTTVRGRDSSSGHLHIIEETVLTQSFDNIGRKTGHVRRVAKRLPDLNSGGEMVLLADVTRQDQLITYRPNPSNAAEDVQDVVLTNESGLILIDTENQYLGNPYAIPITQAHQSGYIDTSGHQTVITGDIKTTTEALRVRGQQVDVETRVVDHLSNTPTQTNLTTRPGIISMSRTRGGATRTMMIVTPGTEGVSRRTPTLDATALPADVAIELGERKLRRLNNPPRQLSLSPAYVDLAIKRGSLLAIEARGETVGNYIVEGFSIAFAAFQPERGAEVSMAVTLREVADE